MSGSTTKYDEIMSKLKNNWFIVVLFLAVPTYLAISSVIEATEKNRKALEIESDDEKLAEPTQPSEKTLDDLSVRRCVENGSKKLQMCCGSTGKRHETRIHSIIYEKKEKLIVANITVSWVGGMSGTRYSITGNLIFDYYGTNPKWNRLGQNGVMYPGCASGCNLGDSLKY